MANSESANYRTVGDFSQNTGHSNVMNSHNTNITHNYSRFPGVPKTFKDLIASTGWGVSPPEIDLNHLCDKYNRPEPGTGEWIFENAEYKQWQESEESELLWLCGGPGTGKTVLTKFVAAKLLEGLGDPPRGVKLFFLFISPELPTDGVSPDETEPPECKLAKVACDLLFGILQQDGDLFHGCKEELEMQRDNLFTNKGSIWKVLERAIQDCLIGSVYILIDGVDGFQRSLCEELIERIRSLMDIRNVKIFLSSRDVPHVSNSLCENARINLDKNEYVKEDVEKCIKSRVNKFRRWSGDQMDKAINVLSAKSEGTFLWASLAMKNLKLYSTGPDCGEFLGKIPSELNGVYGKMLYDVDSGGGSGNVRKMIRNVALALRPLTYSELAYIQGHGGKADKEIKQYIKSSQGFLRDRAKTVSIVHYTAIEFLFSSEENRQDNPRGLSKGDFDLTVSWECFQYLHLAFAGLAEFRQENGRGSQGIPPEPSPNSDRREGSAETPQELLRESQNEAMAKFPFLRYAAESWFIHARRSIEIAEHEFCDDTHDWLEHPFFGTSDTIRKPWIEFCGDPRMRVLAGDQPKLHIAVCLGLTPLVKMALSSFEAESQGGKYDQSPLHLAAKFMTGAYKVLIDNGGPSLLTGTDEYGNTPLHVAAISGYRPMLADLVIKFAKSKDKTYRDQINNKNKLGDTPLHLAVQFDHPDIVKFLVENKADLAIKNSKNMTASELGAKLGRRDSSGILEQAERGTLGGLRRGLGWDCGGDCGNVCAGACAVVWEGVLGESSPAVRMHTQPNKGKGHCVIDMR